MKPNTVRRDIRLNTINSPAESAGLISGSTILTLNGETLVDCIKPGQRVITRDFGTARVLSVLRHQSIGRAIRIKAGSLGNAQCDYDVVLPAGQGVLVRDWRARALFGAAQVVVPAARLIDGEFVTDLGRIPMTIFEIEFDHPHILYADGLEVAGHVAATTAIAA